MNISFRLHKAKLNFIFFSLKKKTTTWERLTRHLQINLSSRAPPKKASNCLSITPVLLIWQTTPALCTAESRCLFSTLNLLKSAQQSAALPSVDCIAILKKKVCTYKNSIQKKTHTARHRTRHCVCRRLLFAQMQTDTAILLTLWF